MEKGGRGTRKCRVFAQRRDGMAGDKKAERAEKEEEGPEGREREERGNGTTSFEARVGGKAARWIHTQVPAAPNNNRQREGSRELANT